jgi:hypothetical protein
MVIFSVHSVGVLPEMPIKSVFFIFIKHQHKVEGFPRLYQLACHHTTDDEQLDQGYLPHSG